MNEKPTLGVRTETAPYRPISASDAELIKRIIAKVRADNIPTEVFEHARWQFGDLFDAEATCSTFNPSRLFFVRKDETSRGQGWDCALRLSPNTRWRKCHTEHYWAWYDTGVANPYPKKSE